MLRVMFTNGGLKKLHLHPILLQRPSEIHLNFSQAENRLVGFKLFARCRGNDGEAKFALASGENKSGFISYTLAIANFRIFFCHDTTTCLLRDLGKSACDVGITSKTHTFRALAYMYEPGGGCMFSIFITFMRPGTKSASTLQPLNWPRFVIPEPTDEIIRPDGNNEQRHSSLLSLLPPGNFAWERQPYAYFSCAKSWGAAGHFHLRQTNLKAAQMKNETWKTSKSWEKKNSRQFFSSAWAVNKECLDDDGILFPAETRCDLVRETWSRANSIFSTSEMFAQAFCCCFFLLNSLKAMLSLAER